MKTITITIDREALDRYNVHYFELHKRAKKVPIQHPYHESINVWMIMKRSMMNALKQKWKDFIIWLVNTEGYSNLRIEKCEMKFVVYYPNKRRHDPDNSTPKFILDGFVESGMLIDDDSEHLQSLTLECKTDTDRPRTEITINIFE